MKETTERFALVNGRVVTPQVVETGKAVIIDGSTIAGIVPTADLVDVIMKIDVNGRADHAGPDRYSHAWRARAYI